MQVKCGSCNEQADKWMYICQTESVDVKGGRGSANLVVKCKLCSRESNMGKLIKTKCSRQFSLTSSQFSLYKDIIVDSVAPYNEPDEGKFKTVVKFDCRGMEPCDFSPRVRYLYSYLIDSLKTLRIDLFSTEWMGCRRL